MRPIITVEHEYTDFSLTLQAFLCTAGTTAFNRKEHIDHCWMRPEELRQLDWAAADDEIITLLEKGITL
ncbi:MAG: hypothetical protein HUJ99_00855 [Bacteroidaceae bacterium]|nr:hypothetical protein [Bacteroidaceae bacterium]